MAWTARTVSSAWFTEATGAYFESPDGGSRGDDWELLGEFAGDLLAIQKQGERITAKADTRRHLVDDLIARDEAGAGILCDDESDQARAAAAVVEIEAWDGVSAWDLLASVEAALPLLDATGDYEEGEIDVEISSALCQAQARAGCNWAPRWDNALACDHCQRRSKILPRGGVKVGHFRRA